MLIYKLESNWLQIVKANCSLNSVQVWSENLTWIAEPVMLLGRSLLSGKLFHVRTDLKMDQSKSTHLNSGKPVQLLMDFI